MNLLWKMALRNTIRNRRRTALTVLAVLVGVGMFVIANSFVDGIDQSLVGQEIKVENAHLRIMPAGYLEEEMYYPVDLERSGLVAAEARLKELSPSAKILRRTAFAGEIGDGNDMIRARGISANLQDYAEVLEVGEMGSLVEDGYCALVGVELAKVFSWKVGDVMSVRTRTASGSINALQEVKIVGLVAAGHMLIDNNTFFVSHQTGQTLLDVDPDFYGELLVRLGDPDEVFALEDALHVSSTGIETQNWDEKTRHWRELNKVRRSMFNFILGIILLIGASGVANTSLMSGFERKKEIGAMLALGLARKKIVRLFMLEATLIGLMGAVIGTALGGWCAYFYAENGLPIPKMDMEEGTLPIPSLIYFSFDMARLLMALGVGVGIALVSALLPSIKCSSVDPVIALREE